MKWLINLNLILILILILIITQWLMPQYYLRIGEQYINKVAIELHSALHIFIYSALHRVHSTRCPHSEGMETLQVARLRMF